MASDDATPEQSARSKSGAAHNLMLQAREEVIRNRDSYLQPP